MIRLIPILFIFSCTSVDFTYLTPLMNSILYKDPDIEINFSYMTKEINGSQNIYVLSRINEDGTYEWISEDFGKMVTLNGFVLSSEGGEGGYSISNTKLLSEIPVQPGSSSLLTFHLYSPDLYLVPVLISMVKRNPAVYSYKLESDLISYSSKMSIEFRNDRPFNTTYRDFLGRKIKISYFYN